MSDDTLHTCPFCGAKVVDLRGHIVRVHEDEVIEYVREYIEVVSPETGLLYCKVCGKRFVSRGLGHYHIVKHIINGDIKVVHGV